MKVLLCNDTGTKSHIGCQAVSNAHARMLGQLGHKVVERYFVNELKGKRYDRFDDYIKSIERNDAFMTSLAKVDAVIVNGEGTIHHGGGLDLIAALMVAKRNKKATLLVNCLFQEVPIDSEIINSFDYFSVREPLSFEYAKSKGIRVLQHFDSIVAAKFDNSRKPTRNAVAVTDWTKSSNATVGSAATRFLHSNSQTAKSEFFPLHCIDARMHWHKTLNNLSEYRAVITSRHHGIYLAMLAGISVVVLKGNSWKAEGLLKQLRIDLPIATNFEEAAVQLLHIAEGKSKFKNARQQLLETKQLQHFSLLGRANDTTGVDEELQQLDADIKTKSEFIKRDNGSIASRRRQELLWKFKLYPMRTLLDKLTKL